MFPYQDQIQSIPTSAVYDFFSGGAVVTPGIIVMWSGSIATIPSGWVLCDGSNGTPDLRNRFVVAANADDGGIAKTTIPNGVAVQTGGGLQHGHTTNDPGHSHGVNGLALPAGNVVIDSAPGGDLNSEFASTITDSSATDIVVIETVTVPPFFALAFIMKS